MLNPNYYLFVGPIKFPASGALSAAVPGDVVVYNPVTKLALNFTAATDVMSTLLASADFKGVSIGQRLPNTTRTQTGGEGPWRFTPVFAPISKSGTVPAQSNSICEGYMEQPKIAAYADPVPRKVVIDCHAGDNASEMIFQLNLIFKDIRDLSPSVLYKPYYFVAPQNATNAQVAAGLAKSLMDCKNRGQLINVTATATNGKLTILADTPLYDMNQRYEYTMINFDAVVSKTRHAGYGFVDGTTTLNNARWIPGGAVNKSESASGSLGNGYYPVVADAEKRAQARQGVTNWVHFPVQMPRMYTKEGSTYYKYTGDFKKSYRAADDTVDVKTAEQIIFFREINSDATTEARIVANLLSLFS